MAKQAKAAVGEVAVGDRAFTLAMLGLPEIGRLRAFAKAQQSDPMAAVKPHLGDVDPAVQRIMIDQALSEIRRPVAFGSPEFVGAMQTTAGLREVLWLSLKRGGADVDRGASDAAADGMTVDQAGDVFAAAFGAL
jgi:hypothetical protein